MTTHFYGQEGSKKSHVVKKYTIPTLEEVGKGALLVKQFVYPLDHKPAAQAHASTLVETPDGLMIAFFAGQHEGSPEVGIRLSTLRNNEWSWPVEIANGFENDSLRYPTWNPVLFLPKDGNLHLFYKQGPQKPLEVWIEEEEDEDDDEDLEENGDSADSDDLAVKELIQITKNDNKEI